MAAIKVTEDPAKAAVTQAAEARWRGVPRRPGGPPRLAAPSNTTYYGGASSRDASALPCTGIRSTINVVSAPTGSGNGLFAVWNAVELSNSNWAQVGYYTSNEVTTGIYQLWDLPANTILSGGTWVAAAGSHQFTIVYSGAGNVWDFLMDGTLEGSYDLGTDVSGGTGSTQPFEALVEQQLQGGPAFAIPDIEFFTAFESQQNGVWGPVLVGDAFEEGGAPYGVQGHDQDAALAANQIIVGSSRPVLSNGTLLWTGSGGEDTLISNSVVIFVVSP